MVSTSVALDHHNCNLVELQSASEKVSFLKENNHTAPVHSVDS